MTEEIKKGIKISELLGKVRTVIIVNEEGQRRTRTGEITEVVIARSLFKTSKAGKEIKPAIVSGRITSVTVGGSTLYDDGRGTMTIWELVLIDY